MHLAGPQDVLVAGDLHGNVENFRRLLERAGLRSHPDRHLVFQELVHGPFLYPTGGDKSHQLIDLLAALKCQFPRQVHMLLGNHELAQWTNQWIAKRDTELNDLFRQGIETAYGGHSQKIYDAYLDLFEAIPWAAMNKIPPEGDLCSADRAVVGLPAKQCFATDRQPPKRIKHRVQRCDFLCQTLRPLF